ncbi:hypothetical protein G6F43_008526 [Rhizopus delemar]|nr:hypothetical protein G6F43_008526 [Rhizopus delemar]
MTTVPPKFYDIFEPYLRTAANPTLADFVEKNKHTIAAYYVKGEDLDNRKILFNSADVNWGEVALLILSKITMNDDTVVTNLSSNDGSIRASNSSLSTSSVSLTPDFINKFRTTYASLVDQKKWILKTGKVVEDEIFQFGLQCQYEHHAHSFIIAPDNPVWKSRFTADELKEIRSKNPHPLPPCSDTLLNYLNIFTDLKTVDELIKQTRKRHFDFDSEFDLDWAQQSMQSTLRLFKSHYILLTDQSEADIIRRIWYFVDTAFDNVNIDVRTGEKESRASSSRRNQGRENRERKKHGHKTDFLFKFNQGELGCAEVGKEDSGDAGTKEMKELELKCPKMMKDQLWQLAKMSRQHRMDLVVVGFVMMGLKLRATMLDRPSTYICRYRQTAPMFFPVTEETIGSKLGELLTLVSQVKSLLCDTLAMMNSSTLITSQKFGNEEDSDVELPVCPATP